VNNHLTGLSSTAEDGSIDIYGNPPSKKKTGNWKACPFILGKQKKKIKKKFLFYQYLYITSKFGLNVQETNVVRD